MKVLDRLEVTWRIASGPARPFLLGKLADLVRRPRRRQWAQRMLEQLRPLPCRSLGLALPPPHLLQQHRSDLLTWANHQRCRAWNTDGCDPREVLEVARMHAWPLYAVAAHLTGDPSWFESFASEVESFHREHPPQTGPLWNVAMDSAIRAVNLVVAWDWFSSAGMESASLTERVAQLAQQHAIAVWGGLETAGGMGTSHLLGDLVGLVVIEAYLGTAVTPEGSVLPWLERETARQILPDGMNFEASTGYHRQVVDLLRVARDVVQVSPTLHARCSAPFMKSIDLALQAQATLEAFGMPLIGDNDDGLCIKLLPTPRLMVDLGHSQTHDADFPDFGLWLRSMEDAALTVRHGPVGQQGKGGHAHNDLNAITLSVGGRWFIGDPGTAVYTADPVRRNQERSTTVHATVCFPNTEQRWYAASDLFWMIEESGTRKSVAVHSASWEGTVRHGGAARYEHRRHVSWQDRTIVVTDTVASLPAQIVLPFAPGVAVTLDGDRARCTVDGITVAIQWEGARVLELRPLPTAPAYGSSVDGCVLRLAMESANVRWRITW